MSIFIDSSTTLIVQGITGRDGGFHTKQNPLKVPIVIRLTGTNEELALEILKKNGFSAMTDMDEAVQRAVQLATQSAAEAAK